MLGDSNNPFFDSEPGGREAAPGPLVLVQAFVNTREVERGWEAFADRDSLHRWFVDRGILPSNEAVGEEDVGHAREVREALRTLLAANNGLGADARAVEVLNEATERARLGVRFGKDGRVVLSSAAGGVDGALGRVLAAVHAGMEEGTWRRLKACSNGGCTWVFYDRSKNRSGRWCSMEVCGNRTKTRTYRRRTSAPGS